MYEGVVVCQELAGFRLVKCFFHSLVAGLIFLVGPDDGAQIHRARTLTDARVSASHVRAYAL